MAPTKASTSAASVQQQQQKKQPKVQAKTMAKTKGPHKPKNTALNSSGLMKYSRARIFQRKAVYKVKKVKTPVKKAADEKAKQSFVVKKIGGEKNGGERKVYRKTPKSFPTNVRQRKANLRPKKTFKKHVRHIRPNLKPGAVLIVLAGRHKGKRVVLLKVLESGLLLVTGPRKLNGCPLRRVSQRYVIGTRTRIDVSKVALPERINDAYFRRQKSAKAATKKSANAGGGDIFAKSDSAYTVSAERREDQTAVDKAVMAAIKASGEGALLRSYLRSLFSLSNSQRPHQMLF